MTFASLINNNPSKTQLAEGTNYHLKPPLCPAQLIIRKMEIMEVMKIKVQFAKEWF